MDEELVPSPRNVNFGSKELSDLSIEDIEQAIARFLGDEAVETIHGRPMNYILDGHTPVPASSKKWSEWFENTDLRRVKEDNVEGIRVSTVFMGVDIGWEGPPMLYETMVFWVPPHRGAGYQERYSSWEEAEAGHDRAVKTVVRQIRAKNRRQEKKREKELLKRGLSANNTFDPHSR
jgi:hypothetical protein